MFNFDLKKTGIYKAVLWERNPLFRFAPSLKRISKACFFLVFLLFLYGFIPENFSYSLNRKLLGFSLLFFSFYILFWLKESFLNLKIKKPELKSNLKEVVLDAEKYNLAEFLSFESAKAVFKVINFARSKRIFQIDPSFLLFFLLRDNQKLNFIFLRSLLDPKEIKEILLDHFKTLKKISSTAPSEKDIGKKSNDIFDENFKNVIFDSLNIAVKREHERIEITDLISSIAKHDLIFKKILINSNLKPEDIENLSLWLESLERKISEQKKFWEWKNLVKLGSIGKEWASGYTVTLDKFSTDLSQWMRMRGFPEIVGHEEEIKEIERILSRTTENNVLIVGEPGSGRKSMVQAFATRVVLGESLPNLNYKRIVQLDLSLLLSQSENVKMAGDLLEVIFSEVVRAGNVILVIDEFHNFVKGVQAPGVIDISGVLRSYLELPQFQIIAITSYKGLHKYIEQDPSLLNLFEKVEISEISHKETLIILENLTLQLENKYKRFVSYQALRDIIFYCDKYLQDVPFPEKAVELLDEIMIYVAQLKEKVVLPTHVKKIISDKTEIPVGEVEAKEKEVLLNLEELIHKRIINQDEAVKEVSSALRRARAQITMRKGPIGSFLFLGPTGVGKTETSKSLAEIYFGSEERMIRLDMSEFQNVSDVARLIGSPGEEGLLTTEVRENPFSLVLLDEIEKAHPKILNLFLQVLDEGHLTDGLGRKIDFKNTIIIATSNAGYLIILDAIEEGKKMAEIKEKLLDFLFEKGIFRPEFLNRFDAVVLFRALSRENLLDIAGLMLNKLRKNLAQKDIEFIITKELKEKIVELSYDPKFGAREMRRVIQDKIGNVLAEALLSNKIKRGDKVEVDPEGFRLKVNP